MAPAWPRPPAAAGTAAPAGGPAAPGRPSWMLQPCSARSASDRAPRGERPRSTRHVLPFTPAQSQGVPASVGPGCPRVSSEDPGAGQPPPGVSLGLGVAPRPSPRDKHVPSLLDGCPPAQPCVATSLSATTGVSGGSARRTSPRPPARAAARPHCHLCPDRPSVPPAASDKLTSATHGRRLCRGPRGTRSPGGSPGRCPAQTRAVSLCGGRR